MTLLSVFANSYAADGGLAGWTNPTNAYTDNGSFATRVGTTKNVVYGNLFGFDLSTLPDSATINSVTLSAQWHNSANDSAGPVLTLGVFLAATVYGSADDTSGQTTDEVLTYAPIGLTAAQLKATGGQGFWAILRFRRTDNTAHTAYLDYVKIEIDYTDGAAEITGAADITVDAIGQALQGAVTVSGVGAVAFDGLGAGIAGVLAITSVGAITLDGLTADITGTVQSQSEITGALSTTFNSVGISAAGAAGIAANTNSTLDTIAGSGQGAVIITGESSNTFSSLSITTTGVTEIAGSVSKALDGVTGEIIGVVGNAPVVGLLEGLFYGMTCQAVGVVTVGATTVMTLQGIDIDAAGTVTQDIAPFIAAFELTLAPRGSCLSCGEDRNELSGNTAGGLVILPGRTV